MTETLWTLRARALSKARKAFLRSEAEGLHDLRVALRRVEATAAALGQKKLERRSRSLVRSLSPLRQIEVDRRLLGRLRETGHLTESVAAGLDARWGAEHARGVAKAAARIARGRKLRRFRRRLRRLARRRRHGTVLRLERERRRVERRLSPPGRDATDRHLHRYRIAIKRARYLSEDLAACGVPGLEGRIAREKEVQEALGRWNDLQLFRERLIQTRAELEERGSVTSVLELDHLIGALEGAVASARGEALAVSARAANVLPFAEQSA